jgi:hypothetical protein
MIHFADPQFLENKKEGLCGRRRHLLDLKLYGLIFWLARQEYISKTNLGFSVKDLSEQEKALFEGKGKIMRHVKFYSLENADYARVVKLLRLVAKKGLSCSTRISTFLGLVVGLN